MKRALAGGCALLLLLWTGCNDSGSPAPTKPPPATAASIAPGSPTSTSAPGPALEIAATSVPRGPTDTAVAEEGPSVAFESPSSQVRPGESFEVAVVVDPASRGVSGVQVRLEYDPRVLRALGARPGPLMGENPAEAGPIIDVVPGTLDYAVARLEATTPPTPPGIFATFDFQVQSSAPAAMETTIRLAGVKVPDESILEIPGVRVGRELTVKIGW